MPPGDPRAGRQQKPSRQGWINNADDALIEASHWQIMMEAPHVQACAQHITRWLCANLNATGEHVMMPSASPKNNAY